VSAMSLGRDDVDAFYEFIADCEERLVQRYSQLKREIEAEQRLLSFEREDFIRLILERQAGVVELLKERVARAAQLQTQPQAQLPAQPVKGKS
jgi:hypothetical protein